MWLETSYDIAGITKQVLGTSMTIDAGELVERIVIHPQGGVEGLVRLAGNQETEWLDLKAGLGPPPGKPTEKGENVHDYYWHVAKAVIAMANTRGGAVVLGIKEEKGKPISVGLGSVDPKGILSKYGTDEFFRKCIDKAIRPEKGWKTGKAGHWQLGYDYFQQGVSYKISTFEGQEVVVILIRPIPQGEKLLDVEQTEPIRREILLVRDLGAVGRVREIWRGEEKEAYRRQRAVATTEHAGLWERFLQEVSKTEDKVPDIDIDFIHSYQLPKMWADRSAELDELFSFLISDVISCVAVIAMGGTGKSAITRKLIDRIKIRNPGFERVFWYSFNAEPSVDRLLEELYYRLRPGTQNKIPSSPYGLAALVRKIFLARPFLLVLDGIETMTEGDANSPHYGELRDRVLRDFLVGICQPGPSKVILTSRRGLVDLQPLGRYHETELSSLHPKAAVSYMRDMGVKGYRYKLEEISRLYGNHVLTLNVLCDFLVTFCDGDINQVEHLPVILNETHQGEKLKSILEGFWDRLDENQLYFMKRLCLFTQGVPKIALKMVFRGKTDTLLFKKLLVIMERTALVQKQYKSEELRYTTHPLVKSYFYEHMDYKEKVRGHRDLADYFASLPSIDSPSRLNDFEWVIEAYHHYLLSDQIHKAEEIYRSTGLGKSLFNWCYFELSLQLLDPLLKSLSDSSDSENQERLLWLLQQTAMLHDKAGRPRIAEERFERAAKLARDTGRILEAARLQRYLSEPIAAQGRYNDAIEALRGSVDEKGGPIDQKGREGIYRGKLGEHEKALELLERAAESPSEEGDLCWWIFAAADVLYAKGDYENAIEKYRYALKLSREIGYRDYEGHIHRGTGELMLRLGEIDKASKSIRKAQIIAEETGYRRLEGETLLSLVRLNKTIGDETTVRKLLSELFELCHDSGYNDLIEEAKLLAKHDK